MWCIRPGGDGHRPNDGSPLTSGEPGLSLTNTAARKYRNGDYEWNDYVVLGRKLIPLEHVVIDPHQDQEKYGERRCRDAIPTNDGRCPSNRQSGNDEYADSDSEEEKHP
jgi:hypothetical protein